MRRPECTLESLGRGLSGIVNRELEFWHADMVSDDVLMRVDGTTRIRLPGPVVRRAQCGDIERLIGEIERGLALLEELDRPRPKLGCGTRGYRSRKGKR